MRIGNYVLRGSRGPRASQSLVRDVILLTLIVTTTLLTGSATAYERPGRTELVSVTSRGTQPSTSGGGLSNPPLRSDITPDGRYVAFTTHLPLVPKDTNQLLDVYVRDRLKGTTEAVSVNSRGEIGASPVATIPAGGQEYGPRSLSVDPAISSNGRYVAFASKAVNLVPGDVNAAWDVFLHDRADGSTELVSVNVLGGSSSIAGPGSTGLAPGSWKPSMSDDGDRIAFTSSASDLVDNDTNLASDVFVRDRSEGRTYRVSVASDGSQSKGSCFLVVNCSSFHPSSSISGNGRFVAFDSLAGDLVPGDVKEDFDVFVHDLQGKKTEMVSVGTDGGPSSGTQGVWASDGGSTLAGASGGSYPVGDVVSRTGRFITFVSYAGNLVPNDSNHTGVNNGMGGMDVFVRDRKEMRTERISVTSVGEEVYPRARRGLFPTISASGRYVAFVGVQEHLDTCRRSALADQCAGWGVLVHDRYTGSLDPTVEAPTGDAPSIDAAGRFITLWSPDEGLTRDDTNPIDDIFLYDRGKQIGTDLAMSSSSRSDVDGSEEGICIVGDICVPARSTPDVGTTPDGGGSRLSKAANISRARMAFRSRHQDLFASIDLEGLPEGLPNTAYLYGVRFVASDRIYEIRASSVLGGTFGLFDCTQIVTCGEVAELSGGYGTTGSRVVVSLPLETLELRDGLDVRKVEAFSAIGSYHTGPSRILDILKLSRAATGDD